MQDSSSICSWFAFAENREPLHMERLFRPFCGLKIKDSARPLHPQTPEVGECSLTEGLPREKQIPGPAGMTDELQALCFLHPGAEMTTSHLQPIWKQHQSRTPSCPLPGAVLGWAPLAGRKLSAAGFASSLSRRKKKRSRRHSRSGSCSTALRPVLVMALAASLPRANASTETGWERRDAALAHRATALPPTRPHPPGHYWK